MVFNAIVHALFNSLYISQLVWFGLVWFVDRHRRTIWVLQPFFQHCFWNRVLISWCFGFRCFVMEKQTKNEIECACECGYIGKWIYMLAKTSYPLPQTWHFSECIYTMSHILGSVFPTLSLCICVFTCSDFLIVLNNDCSFTLNIIYTGNEKWLPTRVSVMMTASNKVAAYRNVEMFCGETLFPAP